MPLLLPQALWVKRTALRLPDASPPWQGLVPGRTPSAPPLRLLLLGESTVSGVGVDRQADALAGQLAAQLAAITGRPVQWQALGRNGADAQACLQDLLPQVLDQRWDLALLVLGVNDTTHLTSRRQWRTRLACLLAGLSSRSVQVGVTAVPPLGRFTALPQPLRGWFGLRSGLLDRDLRQVAARQHALYLPLDLSFESAYLARDDFHPSAAGYREWAAGIARQWAPLVLPGAEPSLSSVEVGT
ncbi:SGNH/GDSL hydrolase family protein [Pseudomonas neustonica]|uniref:SGNH/GDSL hydrolase family protein n=1 Tax=Pseudomonas neustonica TaxID=2487346 RepID=UPI003F480228